MTRFLICAAAALLLLCQSAQAQTTSLRGFDLAGGGLLAPREEGGYLLVSEDDYISQPVLVRLDGTGETVSCQMLDPTLSYRFINVALLADGRHAVVGFGVDTSHVHAIALIVDSAGQPGPARLSRLGSSSEWYGVAPTADSGFLALGNGFNAASNYVGMLAKYDAQMDTTWTRLLQPGPNEWLSLKFATELPGGNILAAGERSTGTFATYQLCLYKFTADGDLLWAKEYPLAGQYSQPIRDMQYDGHNGIYVASLVRNPSNFAGSVALSAFDTTGAFLWADSIGGLNDPEVRGMDLGPAGEVVLTGDVEDGGIFDHKGFNLAVGPSGLLWANSFDISGGGILFDVLQQSGGGYVMTAGDFMQAFLLTTDAQGALGGNCGTSPLACQTGPISTSIATLQPTVGVGIPTTVHVTTSTARPLVNQIQCFATAVDRRHVVVNAHVAPQPMHTSAQILLPALRKDAQVFFYDLNGRAISLPAKRLADGFEIERGGVPAGLYGYQILQSGLRIASGKFWVAD